MMALAFAAQCPASLGLANYSGITQLCNSGLFPTGPFRGASASQDGKASETDRGGVMSGNRGEKKRGLRSRKSQMGASSSQLGKWRPDLGRPGDPRALRRSRLPRFSEASGHKCGSAGQRGRSVKPCLSPGVLVLLPDF